MSESFEDFLDKILPEDWGHDADEYGIDCSLICPCDIPIEQDGECPNGHVSPMKGLGLI
jgi:hypothetical protein